MEAIERRWVARRREAVAAGHVMGPRRSAQNAGLGGADVETDDLAPAGLMDGVRDHDRLARNAAAVVDLLDLGVDEQIRVHHLSGLDSWPSPGVVEHALRDLVCCADRRRRRSADVDAARDAVRSAALRRRTRAAADGARLAAKLPRAPVSGDGQRRLRQLARRSARRRPGARRRARCPLARRWWIQTDLALACCAPSAQVPAEAGRPGRLSAMAIVFPISVRTTDPDRR
jgi:hypothetical protein